jgi:hypothetical protein
MKSKVLYCDGRPTASMRLLAKDVGVVIRHGDGPGKCDALGARDPWVWRLRGRFYMHYDGAGPEGWLACLATSSDGITWSAKGPIWKLGRRRSRDSASASYATTFFDGRTWHSFYLGTPNSSPAPNHVPSFPYLTMKAIGSGPCGPWHKRYGTVPLMPKAGSYYALTASPGQIIRHKGSYLMFFSASAEVSTGRKKVPVIQRTLGIARTRNLSGRWRPDADPILPLGEQIENSSLHYEAGIDTWFLFTNHVAIREDGTEYTDAIWFYWTKDLNTWSPADKAVILDRQNCRWSRFFIGLPSVVKVGDRLAVFYDGQPGKRFPKGALTHMNRDIGLAWLELPLRVPSGVPNHL